MNVKKMLKKSDLAYWCVVWQNEIWSDGQNAPFLTESDVPFDSANKIQIGEYEGHSVYWLSVAEKITDTWCSLRALLHLDCVLFGLLSRGMQFSHAQRAQKFCGACGGQCLPDIEHDLPIMRCPSCSQVHYSPISPCVIMAVRRGDCILLAQHLRHKTPLSTVLAGFVEAGETLEQTVAREVFEETQIQVKNVRYFASQPWAFPSQLMVGFLADHEAGEITVDKTELMTADWFDITEAKTQALAPEGTLARALIEHTFFEIEQSAQSIDD